MFTHDIDEKVYVKWIISYSVLLGILLRDFVLIRFGFLLRYYHRSENIWNDGFLFDFLQKKTVDLWLRQYVIYTGFLFSERVVFDVTVRLYNDILVWPGHNTYIFESMNTASMLMTTIFIYLTLFISVVLWFSFLL